MITKHFILISLLLSMPLISIGQCPVTKHCPGSEFDYSFDPCGDLDTLIFKCLDGSVVLPYYQNVSSITFVLNSAPPPSQNLALQQLSVQSSGDGDIGPTQGPIEYVTEMPSSIHVKRIKSGHYEVLYSIADPDDDCVSSIDYNQQYVRYLPEVEISNPLSGNQLYLDFGVTEFTINTVEYPWRAYWCNQDYFNISSYEWTMTSGITGDSSTGTAPFRQTSNTFTTSNQYTEGTITVNTYNSECGLYSNTTTIQIVRQLQAPYIVTYPAPICNSSVETIGVNSNPNNDSYTWEIVSGALKIGSNYATGVTILNTPDETTNICAPSSGAGYSIIRVKAIRDGFSSDWTQKTIWIGPLSQPTIDGPSEIDCETLGGMIMYEIDHQPNGTLYQWTTTGYLQIVSYIDNMIEVIPTGTGNATVNLTISNGCSPSASASKNVYVECEEIIIYPNPASSEFTLNMEEFEADASVLSEEYSLELIASDQQVHIRSKSKNKVKKFKLKNVPKGPATVKVTFKGVVHSKMLIIN